MGQALQPCQAPQRIRLQATSTPSANTQNHPNSTHFAAMIYYRKTLFGCGPKLTAVQSAMLQIRHTMRDYEFTFYKTLDVTRYDLFK